MDIRYNTIEESFLTDVQIKDLQNLKVRIFGKPVIVAQDVPDSIASLVIKQDLQYDEVATQKRIQNNVEELGFKSYSDYKEVFERLSNLKSEEDTEDEETKESIEKKKSKKEFLKKYDGLVKIDTSKVIVDVLKVDYQALSLILLSVK